MEITAAVVHERGGAFQVERVELAEPEAGEVLVRIAASGICQTDIHARDGYFPIPYPAVYGHEGVGVVECVGEGVEKVKPGDHVVMAFPSCGTCLYCASGNPAYCLEAARLKQSGTRTNGSTVMTRNGAVVFGCFFQQSSFATFALATERNVVKVPTEVPLELLAAFPCGINTGAGAVLNVLRPQPGDAFAVFGAGTVGLAGLMAARIAGCEPIIAVDLHPNRLSLSRSLGATHTVNAADLDPVIEIRSATEGLGVRISLEAAGTPLTLRQAVDCLRPMGTCCLVGSSRSGTEARLDLNILQKGRTIRGCIQGDSIPDRFIPHLIDLYRAGNLPVERLVTLYDFADINQAVADSAAGKTIKPILRMPKQSA
ncbi:MAG: Alcohol dehydrogenase zinc-binding domain protein [Deltaproteobacteria bacterium]|nr:Alcohol dehydrogenase zinc-binding domain protein [Deltaproteobacteria bacterium]